MEKEKAERSKLNPSSDLSNLVRNRLLLNSANRGLFDAANDEVALPSIVFNYNDNPEHGYHLGCPQLTESPCQFRQSSIEMEAYTLGKR